VRTVQHEATVALLDEEQAVQQQDTVALRLERRPREVAREAEVSIEDIRKASESFSEVMGTASVLNPSARNHKAQRFAGRQERALIISGQISRSEVAVGKDAPMYGIRLNGAVRRWGKVHVQACKRQ